MRKFTQIFFLAAFTILFFLNAAGDESAVPFDLFLRIDPLLAITTCLASRQLHVNLLLSLIVVASAVAAGRFFCGYICPLGTLLDLAGKKKTRGKRYDLTKAKYYILVFLLVACLFAFNPVHFFDPIAFITRVYTFLIHPLAIMILNLALDAVRPPAEYFRWVGLAHSHFKAPVFSLNIITLLLFGAVIVLNFISHRFWCRNLCPLGALLGLVSRLGVFKRHVDTKCNSCMKCYKDCPVGAIPDPPQKTMEGECIVCNNCVKICPQSAVSLKTSFSGIFRPQSQINLTRRRLFLSAGAGALAVVSHRTDPVSKVSPKRLIRPPGSLPENLFLQTCVRCGECMKVCPTNTLQPSLFESGLEGIWSPRLWPRLAGCDQICRLCGTVCPTDAIRELTLEEKKHAKIGTAFIDRHRCLVWAQDRACFICDEQCPYNAIVFKWQDGARMPFVIDTKCNGCGFCEEQCPVNGESAIIVSAQGEIRLAQGSYIKKAEELQLILEEDPGDDGFFDTKGKKGKEKEEEQNIDKLPEGFSLN